MGAIEATTKQGRLHTPDLGGEASTEMVTESVLDVLG